MVEKMLGLWLFWSLLRRGVFCFVDVFCLFYLKFFLWVFILVWVLKLELSLFLWFVVEVVVLCLSFLVVLLWFYVWVGKFVFSRIRKSRARFLWIFICFYVIYLFVMFVSILKMWLNCILVMYLWVSGVFLNCIWFVLFVSARCVIFCRVVVVKLNWSFWIIYFWVLNCLCWCSDFFLI